MGCGIPRTHRLTGTLEESYCCPTSAHHLPPWLATNQSCVDPVLSVPDSSAPSPPGPSGSGLFAGELIPTLGQRKLVLFLFGDGSKLSRHSGARQRVRAKRGPMTGSARARNP